MSCSCSERQKADPMTQCSICAKKHFDDAYGCWHEFLYTDENRDHIHRQLRAAVNHTFIRWPETAKHIRDLAQMILMIRDSELTTEWDDIQKEIDRNFYADHPDAEKRLETYRKKGMTDGHLLQPVHAVPGR